MTDDRTPHRFLALDIGCAECSRGHGEESDSIVKVIGRADTVEEAHVLAKPFEDHHNWLDRWTPTAGGWFAAAGDGELRIIDLEAL